MSDRITVAIDGMGGVNAPSMIVTGIGIGTGTGTGTGTNSNDDIKAILKTLHKQTLKSLAKSDINLKKAITA